jgi:hypothetical protein
MFQQLTRWRLQQSTANTVAEFKQADAELERSVKQLEADIQQQYATLIKSMEELTETSAAASRGYQASIITLALLAVVSPQAKELWALISPLLPPTN